jgi:hypothetical protein
LPSWIQVIGDVSLHAYTQAHPAVKASQPQVGVCLRSGKDREFPQSVASFSAKFMFLWGFFDGNKVVLNE